MKKLLAALLLAFAFLAPHATRADSPEAVTHDTLVQMDKMAEAILSVKDKATAEKAVADLLGIAGELKQVAARAKAVGQPTAEQKQKLQAQLQTHTIELKKRLAAGKEQLAS